MKRNHTRYTNAIISEKEKFCTGCYKHRNTKDSKWKVSVTGKTKRWLCNSCYTNIKGEKHGRK